MNHGNTATSTPFSRGSIPSKVHFVTGWAILLFAMIPLVRASQSNEPTACRVCGCDNCVGEQYDSIGNPGGILPIPPKLQSGALADVSEVQCFWLPYMEIFLGGLDFCTDDALRLQQEFREICGCAELPDGVDETPGSLEDFLETLVDNPACNVCGSDTTIRLSGGSSEFTVPASKIDIFPSSIIDSASINSDGSAVIACETVELAGSHHHFTDATCSAIQQLQEFRDGCECRAKDDQLACDLCGCEGCPPFAFQMANPMGTIAIPEEVHNETFGLTEIHCWMFALAAKEDSFPDEHCSVFQTSNLFRDSCGCPPLPEKPVDDNEETSPTMQRSKTKNPAGAVFAAVLGISAVAVFAYVLYRKKQESVAGSKGTADGITIDEPAKSTVHLSNENVFI